MSQQATIQRKPITRTRTISRWPVILLIGFYLWVSPVEFGLAAGTDKDWPNVGGDKGCSRYSELAQINRKNVKSLQVAWTYHTGDAGKGTTIECTPIVIGNVMYATTAASKVVALDGDSGCER